jgi:purine-nucleoside phosphorylase
LLSDVLTLFLALDNPLSGPQFLDMSEVFDEEMKQAARKVLMDEGVPFREGIYAYYHGPNYETPADKMALKMLGADVVGMSTVPEIIMARWLGVQVLSFAFVTNLAFVKHDHHEVLAESEKAADGMSNVLSGIVAHMN